MSRHTREERIYTVRSVQTGPVETVFELNEDPRVTARVTYTENPYSTAVVVEAPALRNATVVVNDGNVGARVTVRAGSTGTQVVVDADDGTSVTVRTF